MGACHEKYIDLMHAYLDGEIHPEQEQELKLHLKNCEACQAHMHELSDVVAFMKSAQPVTPPPDLTSTIMASLPKRNVSAGPQSWFRRYPIVTAAAVFLVFMSAMFFGNFSDDQQFAFTKADNIVVEGDTVVVPEGEVIEGDFMVRNGDIRVEGTIEGNLTVINGRIINADEIESSSLMASTAVVTGEIEEIDRIFEWLWFKIKSGYQGLENWFTGNDESTNEFHNSRLF
ncbi:zf-HC2 domain-containing protein [Chryseomicrobium sp. FSL W7-1435]|uniref:zf-HC2 domain-containing protein n=1 Tax=Chryseomicrobium sp. FSL W7-1435 TaxID=2921704 RepID=UPI00315A58C5